MKYRFIAILCVVTILSNLFLGCTPSQTTTPIPRPSVTVVPTRVSPPTATSLPTPVPSLTPTIPSTSIITLEKGEFYFTADGQQSFLFSRNIAGYQTSQYYELLDLTSTGGSKFVRIHLDNFGMGYAETGEVNKNWARKWEIVFRKAAAHGIYVIPVFGVWYDWNDGDGYSTWKSNPLNEINGGPARIAGELFVPDSATQKLWLDWMKTLVERWQGQENIIAWEIFSEVNMVPGTTEPEAIDFVNNAAALIHSADPLQRPVTASLADFGNWSGFYRSDSIEFINIHPYPVSGKLDSYLISAVRSMLAKYHKPVLIGESGLSFETPDSYPPTLTTADRANLGIEHATWAAVVSGAMNGRSLWWEDGVAIYFPSLSMPFIQKYAEAELPAANFVRGVDFTSFQPLTSTASSGILRAAVGNEKMVLGWYRDATSEPPNWNLKPKISKQTVSISVSGTAANWQVDFYNTRTGTDQIGSVIVTRTGDKVMIPLPDFTDDIAFKMYPK
ncbi:MAG: hypothetical protein ACM34H_01925 [Deltaproteobacteria bacterium]